MYCYDCILIMPLVHLYSVSKQYVLLCRDTGHPVGTVLFLCPEIQSEACRSTNAHKQVLQDMYAALLVGGDLQNIFYQGLVSMSAFFSMRLMTEILVCSAQQVRI